MFQEICRRWFTPHIDLFATRLNHNIPLYISRSRPTSMENRWCEHKLVGSHSIRLPSNSTSLRPSEGDLKNLSVQLAHHPDSPRLAKDALVLGPSAALNGNPTTITVVGSLTTKCFTIIHNISTFMPGF